MHRGWRFILIKVELELSNAVGRRYAKALFELAKEAGSTSKVSKSLEGFSVLLEENAELKDFVASPIYSREQQSGAIREIAKKAGMDELASKTLGAMAQNGRLGASSAMIEEFNAMVNAENEEIIANVTSAEAMSAAQKKKLAEVLKSKVGKDVKINETVDPDILGGLVVNIGSMMIDNSLQGKLSKLHNAMKEVG